MKQADALIAGAFLAGTNMRLVRRALAALFGGAVGKDTVSRIWRKVGDWDAWNARSLKDANRAMLRLTGDLLKLIWCFVIGLFRSRDAREAEIVALRHQPNVLRRKAPKRLVFSNFDRFVFACLYRIAPAVLNTLVIVKPETVIR
jgi:hypothetical protein